ncbi:MAG TPA: hypothetical protein VEA41_02455, partial [Salinarimonas sp.]|nr:hypothetical protein [Salinarimonas sp.]
METSDRQALPPLFPRHVRRPRLTRLLDETKAQVIVLTAPAGYGKTTLAAEWLQQRENVAWYRATEASADVAAFAAGIARSARRLVRISDRLDHALKLPSIPTDPSRRLAEIIADDISAWPDGAWIVVDDYHLAASRIVEEFLKWLIAFSPVQLVVTTRRRPSWLTARHLMHGHMLELNRTQLALRPHEAAEVLKGLSRAAVRTLLDSAEGWPALIGLGALAAQTALPEEEVGSVLFTYLAEEILRSEEEAAQQFMVMAALLPTLDPDSCRTILDDPRADAILRDLSSRGLVHRFGGSDHFHPLLREFLIQKLAERPGTMQQLTKRATRYFRERRAWDEAFAVAVSASELGEAAEIVGQAATELLKAGRVETLERWLMLCGPASFQPVTRIAQAGALIRRGRLAEARAVAEEVAIAADADSSLRSRALLLAGQASHLASDYEAAFNYHTRAHGVAKEQLDLIEASWGALIAAVELDRDDLDFHFESLVGAAGTEPDARVRVEIARLMISDRRGSLAGVWSHAHSTVDLAHYADDPMIASNALINFASANSLRGEFGIAQALAEQAVMLTRSKDLDFAVGFALAARGEAEAGLRDAVRSHETAEEMQALVVFHEDPQLAIDHEVLRLKIALAFRGQEGVIPNLDAFRYPDVPSNPYAELLALSAIVFAARGEVDVAHELKSRSISLARTAAVVHLAACFDLVAADLRSPVAGDEISTLLRTLEAADCLGCFVWAYRAYPNLLVRVEPGSLGARIA